MSQEKNADLLEPETSDLAMLRQAVEWVAFGLAPLISPYDEVFRQEGFIRLMYCREDDAKIQRICEAQQKLFVALRKELLPATAIAIEEIEQENYDKDIPYFRKIKIISERQEIACTLWEYDRIFWSESCLIYDHTDGTPANNNSWLLASGIWVDTERLYELFPSRDGDKGVENNSSLRSDETQHQPVKKSVKSATAPTSQTDQKKIFLQLQEEYAQTGTRLGRDEEEKEISSRLGGKSVSRKYLRSLRSEIDIKKGAPKRPNKK